MNKRIFPIAKDCFLIYTGQTSADNKSFLRIGTKENLFPEIQKHIRYIVISDATKIDFEKEKGNTEHMQKGKIRYICNKENQDLLFHGLQQIGVDTNNLFHQDLSTDINNVSKIENKKHFFTIFYDNKNIKLVFNEEIFFDLFNFNETRDYIEEENRLIDLINTLNKLNRQNKNKNVLKALSNDNAVEFDFERSSLFFMQDNIYVPLIIGMFRIRKLLSEENFEIVFNSFNRFYIGKEIQLTLIAKGEKDLLINGFVTEGEVIESEILYEYKVNFTNQDKNAFYKIVSMYQYFLEKG